MPIHSDDPDYARIYAGWLREERPYKFILDEQAYISTSDNGDLFFIPIARDDPAWLDPADPTGRWHNAYGYFPKE